MDIDFETLAEQIQDGECVLFIGPDMSINEKMPIDGEGASDNNTSEAISFNEELAHILSEELSETDRAAAPDSFHHVAHIYSKSDGKDIAMLRNRVRTYFAKKNNETTSNHRLLASMPFQLCVSTTLDRCMENAFEAVNKEPLLEVFNYNGNSPPNLPENTGVEQPVVFKLYGDVSQKSSLVLTEQDLVEFTRSTVVGEPPLPLNLKTKLSDSETIFLFLGFGLTQWHLRLLLSVLDPSTSPSNSSFAFELRKKTEGASSMLRFEKAKAFFRRGKNIIVKDEDVTSFIIKLAEQFEGRKNTATPKIAVKKVKPVAMVGPKPTCFLSYCSEDAAEVKTLAESLTSRGIKVWIDKENLRGGTNWEHSIEDVIKEVNYFIFIQSQKLIARREGVYHQELRVAERRRARMPRHGTVFIIPIQLDRCEIIQDIARQDLHSIEMWEKDGLSKLVKSIKSDWSKRQQNPQ